MRTPSLARIFLSVVLGLLLMFSKPAYAQGEVRINVSTPNARAKTVEKLRAKVRAEKAEAEAFAAKHGLPVRGTGGDGRSFELLRIENGRPLYYTTCNDRAAISTATDTVRNASPFFVSGASIRVGVWDEGSVLSTHQEFGGRVSVLDGATSSEHSTHVGGTIGAFGVVPRAMGMAPGALLRSYDWIEDQPEMVYEAAASANDPLKLYISNHSYGPELGWQPRLLPPQQPGDPPYLYWEWVAAWGASEDDWFGQYDTVAREWDAIAYNAPYYLIVKAAGNDRGDGPSDGDFFIYTFNGNIDYDFYDAGLHPPHDGGASGFDTIGLHGNAKNILTVASGNDAVTGGVRDTAAGTISDFSGFGPTDDGRIKPDITANGDDVYSTSNESNSDYIEQSGTSMATPNVTGSAALLVEYYRTLFSGKNMRASMLKGLILHTATDVGNPGPDYSYGWGYMDTLAAANHIKQYSESSSKKTMIDGTLNDIHPSRSYWYVWDGTSPIRATIVWSDPPGTARTGLNVSTPSLVNDLDLLVHAPDGTTVYEPYVLNPANPADPATTGNNSRDNVEQVYLATPSQPGVYIVTITHKSVLVDGAQVFSLLVSGANTVDTDSDGDGLSDDDELAVHNTDPNDSDSDHDGVNDGDEINLYDTDPNTADSDGDGLVDGVEIDAYSTNPTSADTDGDGLSDGEEIGTTGTNPLLQDSDGDGYIDSTEIADGTDPNLSTSYPSIPRTYPAPLNTNAAIDSGSDTIPQLAMGSAGNCVAVWHSNDSLGGSIGTDNDILASRSTDHGRTWSAPAALNTTAATDSGSDLYPRVTMSGGGVWLAVWQSTDSLGGTLGTDNDILLSRSTDNGSTWSAPVALNTNASADSGSDERPQTATDGGGHWVAVWHSNDSLGGTTGADYDILVSRSTDDGITWTAPAALNVNAITDSGYDFRPQVATDGNGTWLSIWQSADSLGGTIGTDDDVLVSRSTDNGVTWTAPAAVNTNAAFESYSFEPQLATDRSGLWLVTWYSWETLGGTIGSDRDILVSKSTNDGVTWTAPVALNTNASTDTSDDFLGMLATDDAGTWVAVWHSNNTLGGTIGSDEDILIATSTDNAATWSAPIALNTNAVDDYSAATGFSGQDSAPFAATDGAGYWIVAWHSTAILGDTIGTDNDILFTRWAPLESIDSDSDGLSDADENAVYGTDPLDADSDNDGIDDGAEVNTYHTDPLSADSDGDGLDDHEELFGHETDPLSADPDGDGLNDYEEVVIHGTDPFSADSDGDGLNDDQELNVYHTEPTDPDTDNDGFYDGEEIGTYSTDPLHEDSDGDGFTDTAEISDGTDPHNKDAHTWIPRTYPLPLNTNAAIDTDGDSTPQLTTDGKGHWVAVWSSSSTKKLRIARSTDNGATWTTPASVPAFAFGNVERTGNNPQVATDGEGNWVMVWATPIAIGVTQFFLSASISTDNGATWSTSILIDTNHLYSIGRPSITTDAQGNWLVAWSKAGVYGGDLDVFLSRSTDNGATWTGPAALNSNAATDSGFDSNPTITTDRAGNWVAVWQSNDTLGGTIGTDNDILTARSTDNGASWTAPTRLNTNAATDTGHDLGVKVSTDGMGHWVAAWYSSENLYGLIGSDYDIFVARSVNNGATWSSPLPINYTAVVDVGSDTAPQITTDNTGNWIVVWQSTGNAAGGAGTGTDVLAARSTDNGVYWTDPLALNTNAAGESGNNTNPQLTTDGDGHWIAVWESTDTLRNTLGADIDVLFCRSTLLALDSDGDGLSDVAEINTYGTDPNSADTDGDGLDDASEVNIHHTNPLDVDTDGDGVSDAMELEFGTDPLDEDDTPSLPVLSVPRFEPAAD